MANTKKEKVIYNEITAINGDAMGAADLLADEQLNDLNEGLSPYKLLLKDAQITACYEQRFNALIACDWQVIAGGQDKQSQMAADHLREQIQSLDWDDINKKMAYGRHYGYSVAELMFIQDGGYVGLSDIFVRERSRFEINHKKEIFLLDGMQKKALPNYKFWAYICGSHDHDAPTGLGLGYQLFWPAWFKKHAAKFWAVYIEKFASPTGQAKYSDGASDEEKQAALTAAKGIARAKGVAVPKDVELGFLEALRSSSGDYKAFLEYWDGAIAKIIMGQKGTTEVGQYVGTANAHGKVAQNIIKADADLLCGSFNKTVIPFLTSLNFPNASPPKIWRNLETAEEREARIKEDKEIFVMGRMRTDENFSQIYGDGFERIPESLMRGIENRNNSRTEFSETTEVENRPPLTYTDTDEITQKLASDAEPYLSNMLQKIRDTVFSEKVTTLEELAAEIEKLYPTLDDDAFNALMAEALEYSYMQGAADEK